MSKQYPGGIISKTPVVPSGPYENSTASGIWTLDQQAYWRKLNQWPIAGSPPPDAQFNYVTMLLHGDGTNGAQNNTFVDSSSSPFAVTRNGNTTQGSFSPYGSNWSNYFDGNDSLSGPTNNAAFQFGTGDFTVEAWVYQTVDDTYPSILEIGNHIAATGILFIKYGTSSAIYSGGFYGASATTMNGWNHIAYVRSSGSLKIYVNGVSPAGVAFTNNLTDSNKVTIGTDQNLTAGYYFTGNISNLRVVKGTAVYTSNFTPSTAPLTAISGTSLLTCQSNRFIDNSGNSFPLTVNGNTSVQRFNPFGASSPYSTNVIGGSAYFDGTGDNLAAAANSSNLGTGDFNITFWMYATADPTNDVVATNAYNASFTGGWLFQVGDPTTLYFYCGSASGGIGGTVPAIQNQWSYVEATRSGSTIRLFVNGVQINSATNSTSGTSSGNVTRIGARLDGTSLYFPGYITDFKVVVGTAGNTSAYTPPTAPASATGSTLMLSMQNAAIFDNAMMNDLETVGNAQISTSVVKYGTGSMSFDGTGDYLKSPILPQASFNTGSFTVEFWAYLNDNTNTFDFCGTATWANYIGAGLSGWSVSYVNESVSFSYQSNNNYVIATSFSGTTLNTGTWYHIAIVRSSNVIKCYVNGVASATTISSSTNMQSNAYGVWVGTAGNGNVYNYYLNGYMDDLRITNGYARYTANFTPPTAAFPNFGPT